MADEHELTINQMPSQGREVWQATPELRWALVKVPGPIAGLGQWEAQERLVLQQRWVLWSLSAHQALPNEEWRDVPVVG